MQGNLKYYNVKGEPILNDDTRPEPNYIYEIKYIQDRLENIIDALQNAIEKGNDLHLGIVVGQTLSQLKDIARR